MGNSESNIKKNLEGKKLVVVVGGGYGGVAVAKALDKHFNVLLIDRKQYFFHNIGALRATVDPSFSPNIAVPYDKLLKYGYVINAEVEEVTRTGIKVKGREELINFDYLVISLGTSYAFPSKVALSDPKGLPSLYQEASKAVESAKSITIIGGGPVGIELVGEISHKYPDKPVTIIHAHDKLSLGNTSEAFHADVEKKIRELSNVKLITGERAKLDEIQEIQHMRFATGKRTITTDNPSTKVETDLVFFCGGSKINNSSLKQNFSDKMDEKGRLKVNKFLQVQGIENIFSIGDCANVAEGKLGYLAGMQGGHAANNIILHDASKDMKEYKLNPPGLFLTIGPKKGAGQLPNASGTLLGNTMVSFMKGGNLFVNKFWSDMNQKPPKNGATAFSDDREETESKKNKKLKELSRMSSFMKISDQEAKKLVEGFIVENAVETDHT